MIVNEIQQTTLVCYLPINKDLEVSVVDQLNIDLAVVYYETV